MSVPDPESHATTFLELVMPQMPRWREATFVNVDWESMKDLQRNPAPRLQRLVLDTDEDTPSPLILFGGMAPLLKHVVCMGAPLRWDSAVLSGLLSLNIRLDNRFKVSPNNLVQLLANSPQMVSLRLCQEGRNDVRVPTGTPTMHLPCLNKIDLQLPSLFAESILKVIQAPVCENFALLTKRGSTTTLQTTIPFLQSCVAANLNRRPGGLRMRFSLSDGLFQCWVAHDGEDDGVHHFYEASFENVDAMKLFDWAAGELLAATTEKIPITLAFNFGFQFDTPLRRIFKKVPRTTKVIIQGAGLPEVLWLILALPFERLRPNTPLRWPLPRMREMVVYGQRYDWGCLLEMVTRRYEKGGLQTPSRIQLINSDADDDIVEDIEDIIGPGRITQDTDWESEFDSDLLEEWV
ncbi:hypothetical protein FRB90_003152 [Tulasnella sp. 427]|nr:hypothetical protein FRB90_003152 [Tulasnella sp. 427]